MLQQSTALTGCNKLIHVIACCKNDEMSFKKIVKARKTKKNNMKTEKAVALMAQTANFSSTFNFRV